MNVKNATKLFLILFTALSMAVVVYFYTGNSDTGKPDVEYYAQDQEGNEDDDDESRASDIDRVAGASVIKLSRDIQRQSDIQLIILEPVQQQREIRAAGRVVDIQPLLDLRSRYHEIQGQRRIIEAELEVIQQDFARLQILHKEAGNISGRELQQAKLQMESKSAEYRAAAVRMEDMRNQNIQSWGEVLTGIFLDGSAVFKDLSIRKSVLLLVTVAGDGQIVSGAQSAFVSTQDAREPVVTANFISVAPVTDAMTQGATYFFHAPVSSLRTGMNVDVWIPEDDKQLEGVLIPADSVIWYLDKPWVYIATSEETFTRREVKNNFITRQGWFVTEGFKPGDVIVISGAQMLLSQEFRWSIPDEDDNP